MGKPVQPEPCPLPSLAESGVSREDEQTPTPLRELSAEAFLPRVGESFEFRRPLRSPSDTVETAAMELIQVRTFRHSGLAGAREPFSLLFTLRNAAPLDDRLLHQLIHSEFESCELLLSRVWVPELDRRDGTMYYEAVFG